MSIVYLKYYLVVESESSQLTFNTRYPLSSLLGLASLSGRALRNYDRRRLSHLRITCDGRRAMGTFSKNFKKPVLHHWNERAGWRVPVSSCISIFALLYLMEGSFVLVRICNKVWTHQGVVSSENLRFRVQSSY